MLMKKLSEDHYIVMNDSEIKEGDWYYLPRTNSVYQCKEDPTELNLERRWGVAKITHSTQPESLGMGWMQSVQPFFLSEVKELLNLVDVEKKMISPYPVNTQNNVDWCNGYQRGYNECLENNKDKKYTEDDMVEAYKMGLMKLSSTQPEFFGTGLMKLSDQRLKDYMLPKAEWEVEMVDGKLKLKQ